jgi:two-component system chemotaxis response regulator CheB
MGNIDLLILEDSESVQHMWRAICNSHITRFGYTLLSNQTDLLRRLEGDKVDIVIVGQGFFSSMDSDGDSDIFTKIFSVRQDVCVVMTMSPAAGVTIRSLARSRGVSEFILLPYADDIDQSADMLMRQLEPILQRHEAMIDTAKHHLRPFGAHGTLPSADAFNPGIVLMAASTGGPTALEMVISRIDPDCRAAILVIQHMSDGTDARLLSRLGFVSKLPVEFPEDGDYVKRGHIFLAEAGRHMVFTSNGKIRLTYDEPVNSVRPSADVLFESVANHCKGEQILSIVMTGMGKDGAVGVEALKTLCRCVSVTQSEETCVVYGMPHEVASRGLSDISLPLDEIATVINMYCGKKE